MPSFEELVRGCQVELAHVSSGDPQQFLLLGLVELDDEVADTKVHKSLPLQYVAVKIGVQGSDNTNCER